MSLYLQRCLSTSPECEAPRVIHVPTDRGVSHPPPSFPAERIHHSFSYLPTEQLSEPFPRFHLSTDHLSFPLSTPHLLYNETPPHRILRRASRTESPSALPACFQRPPRVDSDRLRADHDSYGAIPAGVTKIGSFSGNSVQGASLFSLSSERSPDRFVELDEMGTAVSLCPLTAHNQDSRFGRASTHLSREIEIEIHSAWESTHRFQIQGRFPVSPFM